MPSVQMPPTLRRRTAALDDVVRPGDGVRPLLPAYRAGVDTVCPTGAGAPGAERGEGGIHLVDDVPIFVSQRDGRGRRSWRSVGSARHVRPCTTKPPG
jgi:hypothetical protein